MTQVLRQRVLLCGLLLAAGAVHAQGGGAREAAPDSLRRGRFLGVVGGGGLVIGGTLVGLDQAWYQQYGRTPFKFFNDGREWQGMDKVGHLFATYTVGEWGHSLLRWSGVRDRTALWVRGAVGLAYLTGVEYLDGRSEGWGFSLWDMAANTLGSGLYIGQQLAWKEQRIRVKYSAHLTSYAAQRPSLLGEGLGERILKDYNGCTIWLTVCPRAFGAQHLPDWLTMAVGYGAEGMVQADPALGQYKQFYLSPDVDLTRLPVRSPALRTLLKVLNCVKLPLPTLEYDGRGRWRAHAAYF